MNTKPTNTLLQHFISIAITVGVVLVFAKLLPGNDSAGGYLIQQQQQQQPPNAGEEEFVIAYGGDMPNYNLEIPELNADPSSFEAFSNPTPTIGEVPTPAEGGHIPLQWLDNFINNLGPEFWKRS